MGPLTYTAWDGVIPLGQGVWHRLAADGRGTLEQVTRVTLKSNDGTCRELRTDPPPISGLWDRTALRVAGAWNGWGSKTQRTSVSEWSVARVTAEEMGVDAGQTVSLFVRSEPWGTSVSPFPPVVSLGITTEVSLRWEVGR